MTAALRKRSNGLAPKSRERIWELDFLRGVCVLLMIFDHFMFDIAGLFDKAWIATGKENIIQIVELAQNYINNSTLRTTTQHIVVWIFALLCGISCSFSRSNLKRGVRRYGNLPFGGGAGTPLRQTQSYFQIPARGLHRAEMRTLRA